MVRPHSHSFIETYTNFQSKHYFVGGNFKLFTQYSYIEGLGYKNYSLEEK